MYNIVLRNFILENKEDWEDKLTKPPYSLKISRDDGFIMFKYNQIESDFNIPLVREARGIIFNEETWDCVCHPFNKFGNYGESYCPEIDWETATVSEKIDGSLIKVWYYNQAWHVSTNGTIDAHKANVNNYKTFYDLFTEALINRGFNYPFADFFNNLDKTYTHMFELVSPDNRVVIPYDKTDLYVIGARNMITGEELSIPDLHQDSFKGARFNFPKLYKLDNIENVKNAAAVLDWDEEGYVVCDKLFNRVKVKSPKYVTAHYSRNNSVITQKRLIEIILSGEIEEFCIYASDYEEVIRDIARKMEEIDKTCNWFLEKANSQEFETRKDFAEYVKMLPDYAQAFLFKAYGNNITFKEYSQNLTIEQWDRLLNMF